MKLPNLFLVGAQKSASTTLADRLMRSPDVDAGLFKEPGVLGFDDRAIYWDADSAPDSMAREWSWERDREAILEFYSGLYPDAGDARYRMDATVIYLASPKVPGRIREISPEAKIIALLREPVARSVSAWGHHIQRLLPIPKPGEIAPENDRFGILRFSDYVPQLRAYLEVFGKERMFVRSFEEFCRSPETVLSDLEGFLGIGGLRELDATEQANPTYFPRFGGRGLEWVLGTLDGMDYHPHALRCSRAGLEKMARLRAGQGDSRARPWRRRLRKKAERVFFTTDPNARPQLPAAVRAQWEDRFGPSRGEVAALFPEASLHRWWGPDDSKTTEEKNYEFANQET